jgi:NAD(P)-dependent dehydrogenase (short-subunit alcohol dehydrogenase family)
MGTRTGLLSVRPCANCPRTHNGSGGGGCTMRIVVTGGAGFIGSNFLNRFVPAHGEHRFINVDKLTYAANPANLEAIADRPNYVFERVDIADPEAVDRVFESHRPDAVVHFAAESHVDRSILGPREFVRTNIEGTFVLLDACRRHWRAGDSGAVPPREHRRGVRLARGRGRLHREPPAMTRRAPTRPPRPPAITWCVPITAPTACPWSSPTAPTTTARISFRRSSSR